MFGKSLTSREFHGHLLQVGGHIIRYGLAIVIAWIGGLKFTATEAQRIQAYIPHSPFMSWMNNLLSVQALSNAIGVVEIVSAVLIASMLLSARLASVGSAIAVVLFLSTLSFLFTTPDVPDFDAGGFPALSALGQFLLKDIVLLGAAVWTLGESLARSYDLSPTG
ncbi:YkgB family protein [Pseudonocardia spinosispora]|uniref:YkgB family protein n=1 Tax=Pseudonocardia spinosispora TaxID=103441 RepID=UPI000A05DF13|nr:DUF417 family protein [Pseudonocardia spinosispora]